MSAVRNLATGDRISFAAGNLGHEVAGLLLDIALDGLVEGASLDAVYPFTGQSRCNPMPSPGGELCALFPGRLSPRRCRGLRRSRSTPRGPAGRAFLRPDPF